MSSVDRLARRIAQVERTVRDVAATPQLARSSIVDGAIDQVQTVDTGTVDEFGNPVFEERVVARYGQQGDGGNTVVTFDDPIPPAPTMPTVTPGPGFMVVGWDGLLTGLDVVPSFVRAVGVFVGLATDIIPSADTLRAELPPTGEGTEVTVGSLAPGEYLVSLVAMTHGGNWSEPAPYRVGGPGTSASVVLIQEAIDKANAAAEKAALAENAATEADKRAAEARALAAAVSAGANQIDRKAVDALRNADVSFLAADGKTTVTYSLNPPAAAPGEAGDTWFQVDTAGVVLGFWECTTGDGATPSVPAPATVTPAAPTFLNRPGTSLDSYTVPAAAGVTYLLDSVPKPPGTYTDRQGPVALVASPQPGYVFPSTATVAWAGTLSTDGSGLRDPVTAAAPVFTDRDGPDNDEVELAAFTPPGGATWRINGDPAAVGTHAASGTVTVEAVPGEMFTFGSAQTVWTFAFDPLRHVTATPPTFTDRSGTTNDTVTIPETTGVVYRVGTVLRSAGTYPASGTVTVTAVPAAGYAINGDTTWTHTYSDAEDTAVEVTPAAPTFTDPPGVASDTYTVPTTAGVVYNVAGSVVTAGTYPGAGTVTVYATPQPGYALIGTSSWTYTWSTARTVVTAAPPGFTDVDGTAGDIYTIPTRTGVQYRVGGVVKAAGNHPGAGTVTVDAEAASDTYQVTGTTQWSFTFDPLAYVTPAAPTFTDQPGTTNDTVTIPNMPGVAYSINGQPQPAGVQPGSGTVVVTAQPQPGYAFTQGAATSWSTTFATTRTTVTPVAPTFTDQNGTANDTVTIPSVLGVSYTINGAERTAGTYPGSGATTVVAAAADDQYVIASGATTNWAFTFDAKFYVTPVAPTFNDTADTYTIPAQTGVEYYVGGALRAAGTYTVPVGATIASTNFTGLANGAAWPAPWTRVWAQGASSAATVQNQAGVVQAAGLANWASKINVVADLNLADVDITYTLTIVQPTPAEQIFHHVMARIPAASAPAPSSGYDLFIRSNGLTLERVANWASQAVLGSVPGFTLTQGTAYRVRFRLEGITLRVKVWPAANTEPTDWQIDVTDTAYATGYVGLQTVGGSSASTPYQCVMDDIVLASPSGGQTVNVTVTAQPAPGYAITSGATTTWTHTFS